MPEVLVTGASGYIGRHLITSFHQDAVQVRGFGRGPRPEGFRGLEWQQGDLRDPAGVERAVRDCSTVVHLGCLPLAPSFRDPLSDFSVNALGTLHVLLAARSAGVRKIVYTSTAQVYGFVEQLPITEYHAARPNSPYGASKLAAEGLCSTFARCYGLSTVILRLFNVYGDSVGGQARDTVEAIFARRIARGQRPVVTGNPEEARDFIHVHDVVRAVRAALARGGAGEIVNIGTGIMTTLLELALLAIELSGRPMTPLVERLEARPLRLQAEVSRAKELLGFEAETSLSQGLSQMLEGEKLQRGTVPA